MNIAVRYYSKLGNTKKIAEAIALGAGVTAASVTEEPELQGHVDVLFLGGAPYANVMAPELRTYAESLSPEKVGRVILFGTSCVSKRTIKGLRRILAERSVPTDDAFFYAETLRTSARVPAATEFAKEALK